MKLVRFIGFRFLALALSFSLLSITYAGTSVAPSAFAKGINTFSLQLLRDSGLSSKGRFLFSPLGIYSNLLSLSSFATKENKQQLESFLYADNPQHTEKDFAQLKQPLSHYFHEYNALWVQQPGKPQEKNDLIPSTVYYLDFKQSKELSAELIDEWAAGKIKHANQVMLSPTSLGDDASMVVTSLTELNSNWLFPFDPNHTDRATFSLQDSQRVSAPFMQQNHYFPFYENRQFSMVMLPYENELLALAVILPKVGIMPKQILEKLKAEEFSLYLSQTHYQNIDLKLIKTSFTCPPISLTKTLKKSNLSQLFQPNSYPSLSENHRLELSELTQMNKLSLTESGTSNHDSLLPAITAVEDPQEKSIAFYTNRPFIVVLYSIRSEAILLIGTINQP